jgi:hypothetical protein
MTTLLEVLGGIAGAVIVQILVFLVLFGGDHRSIKDHERRLGEVDMDISKMMTRTQNLAIVASNLTMVAKSHYNPHPRADIQERFERIDRTIERLDIEV